MALNGLTQDLLDLSAEQSLALRDSMAAQMLTPLLEAAIGDKYFQKSYFMFPCNNNYIVYYFL